MPDSLSICMVSDDFVPGLTGVGVHVQTISRELVRRGHRVVVITARHPGQDELEDWQGVRVYRVPSIPVFGYRQALTTRRFVRRVLRENSTEVVHYHYLGLLLVQAYHAAASAGSGMRHVYTYHMPVDLLSEPWPLRPLRGLLRRLHAVYCNRFDLLVSPSTGLLGQMRGFGIRAPTEVIYNPVETGAMQAALDASAAQPAPGSDSGFVVLYVGRLAPEKNLPLLIRAFALLRQRHPSTVLWLAGDGISRASLEALVSELGLRGGVTFLGFVEHSALGGLYARSHVLVLPSTLEVQGLVAVEAMRFGKPIVLSDRIAAARELVVPGENGFIVPSDDPRELARRLEELAADPGRCRAMGEASLRRSRLYDVGEGIDRLEAAYRLLLGSSDPPAASSAASRGPA